MRGRFSTDLGTCATVAALTVETGGGDITGMASVVAFIDVDASAVSHSASGVSVRTFARVPTILAGDAGGEVVAAVVGAGVLDFGRASYAVSFIPSLAAAFKTPVLVNAVRVARAVVRTGSTLVHFLRLSAGTQFYITAIFSKSSKNFEKIDWSKILKILKDSIEKVWSIYNPVY